MEYQSIGRNITKHRRSEIALQEAKRRYQAVVEDQTELVFRNLRECVVYRLAENGSAVGADELAATLSFSSLLLMRYYLFV